MTGRQTDKPVRQEGDFARYLPKSDEYSPARKWPTDAKKGIYLFQLNALLAGFVNEYRKFFLIL